MVSIEINPLSDEVVFGASVVGVNLDTLADVDVRAKLLETFEAYGLVVFRDMAPSAELHLAISAVFGPLQHHALSENKNNKAEVVNLKQKQDVININGESLAAFLPWHFDACYTEKLNRAALLRPVELPPSGGMTGFSDGVQLYKAISADLRNRFEDLKIIYDAKLMFMNQRFGVPANQYWESISDDAAAIIERCEGVKRAVHPAVWQRESGERVLHVSPWQAAGIWQQENAKGDALLEALCDEIYSKMTPYWHDWKMSDMVLWDNWRYIHSVSGNDPTHDRHMQRATIEGDYGHGFFEVGGSGSEPPSMG